MLNIKNTSITSGQQVSLNQIIIHSAVERSPPTMSTLRNTVNKLAGTGACWPP